MTELALLECVVSNPEEDLPRLVLADWWEENGQPERAEFVRVQVELAAAVPPTGVKDRPVDLLGGQGRVFYKRGRESAWGKRQAFLRRRDREIKQDGHTLWRKVAAVADLFGRPILNTGGCFNQDEPMNVVSWGWSRGFVSSLTCTAADFLRVERALLWPPETMECRTCGGGVIGKPKPGSGPGGQWLGRMYDRCSGTGRIALPRPTDVCAVCEGERIFQTAADPKNSTWTWEEIPCGNCKDAAGKPTGIEPRPFAATCQPITAVRITTDIRRHVEQKSGMVRFTGRQWHRAETLGLRLGHDILPALLAAEWPWVNFTLPNGAA